MRGEAEGKGNCGHGWVVLHERRINEKKSNDANKENYVENSHKQSISIFFN